MTRTGSGRGRRSPAAKLAFIVVTMLAGVAGMFGQSSASTPGGDALRQRLDAARRAAEHAASVARAAGSVRSGISLPDPPAALSGAVGLANSARSTRALLDIHIPSAAGVIYLDPTGRTPANMLVKAPAYDIPHNPVAGCTYYTSVLYADLYAVDIDQPDPTKPGVIRSVGVFPDTPVSLLAFGSIPVTAVLHTSQVRSHGKLTPLTADSVVSYISLPTRPDGDACDPRYDLGPDTPPSQTIGHGRLNITVSDVKVDREAVDVGSQCRTVTPLNLNLRGKPAQGDKPAYIAYSGGTLIERYDPRTVTAGSSTYPVYPNSSNLVIPNFVGCRNPTTGEDYSRLITAMVSSSDNTLDVEQSTAILNGTNTKDPSLCGAPGDGQGCVKYPRHVVAPAPGMTTRPLR